MIKGLSTVHRDHFNACTFRRFYDVMIGPTWMVNATEYGHADMLEDLLVAGLEGGGACASAVNNGYDPHDNIYRCD